MASSANILPGSTTLLADILNVLQRIDRRLEVQEDHLKDLSAKFESFSDEKPRGNLLVHPHAESPRTDSKTFSADYRISPSSNFLPKSYDLKAHSAYRTGSVQSRDPRDPAPPASGFESEQLPRNLVAGRRSTVYKPSQISQTSVSTAKTLKEQSALSISWNFARNSGIWGDGPPSYTKHPPPRDWITTRSFGKELEIKQTDIKAQELWTLSLESLSFKLIQITLNSVAEYRTEVLAGKYKKHPISTTVQPPYLQDENIAVWKRMIEIRGLNKRLVNESAAWSGIFRDPWTEALPILNPICPLLTDREGYMSHRKVAGLNLVRRALECHQKCWRQPPACDDALCFHIKFYVIDTSTQSSLEGDIWRSGALHGENENGPSATYGDKNHKIRESASTIVLICEQDTMFWTSVYLCPDTFDLYEKIPSIIYDLNGPAVLADMVEFSMCMVIDRWEKITDYSGGLIGHRETLADPEAHDSLLFDDDSFSRSRKYFWAINYLAELDISIEGICQEFATIQPKQEYLKPSEWIIGSFFLHKALKWAGLIRRWPKSKREAGAGLRKKQTQKQTQIPNSWQDFQAPELNAAIATAGTLPVKDMFVIEEVLVSKRRGGLASWRRIFRKGTSSSDPSPCF
ncbi:hypothetical protein B7463_g1067, partial [Scytalidium lignicola]